MNSGDSQDVVFYALAVLLPLSTLLVRRLPISSVLKMALAWVAIFALAFVGVTLWRDSVPALWQRIAGGDQIVSGGSVRIHMAADGHFYANASINGVARHMLIDSGATTTALSIGTAKAAGLDLEESNFPMMLSTANGPVTARVSTVKRLVLGPITANGLPVVVAEEFGDADVLGMNFLSRLKGWRVEGKTLVLQPNPPQE